jgi:hypothetical protein
MSLLVLSNRVDSAIVLATLVVAMALPERERNLSNL